MPVAKGAAAMGHEKQMTVNDYLLKVAKAAIKDQQTEAEFVKQFKPATQETAKLAYRLAYQKGIAK